MNSKSEFRSVARLGVVVLLGGKVHLIGVIALALALAESPVNAGDVDLSRPVTIEFHDRPLSKVMAELASVARNQILVEPQIAGKMVTLSLVDVPVGKAIELLGKLTRSKIRDVNADGAILVISDSRQFVDIMCPGMNRTFAPHHVSAATAKRVVESKFPPGKDLGLEIDPGNNSLVAVGSLEVLRSIETLIASIDVPPGSGPTIGPDYLYSVGLGVSNY